MSLHLQHGAERSVAVSISYLTLTSNSIRGSGSALRAKMEHEWGGALDFNPPHTPITNFFVFNLIST